MKNYRVSEDKKGFFVETEYMGRWHPIDKDGVFGWSVTMNDSVEYYTTKDLAEKRITKFK